MESSEKYNPQSFEREIYNQWEKKGFFKGMWMACYRILRCNPYSRGGFDPVEKEESCLEERK